MVLGFLTRILIMCFAAHKVQLRWSCGAGLPLHPELYQIENGSRILVYVFYYPAKFNSVGVVRCFASSPRISFGVINGLTPSAFNSCR